MTQIATSQNNQLQTDLVMMRVMMRRRSRHCDLWGVHIAVYRALHLQFQNFQCSDAKYSHSLLQLISQPQTGPTTEATQRQNSSKRTSPPRFLSWKMPTNTCHLSCEDLSATQNPLLSRLSNKDRGFTT